ncbi:MAG: ABC transporter substrate-binding protein [Chloroflexi bacterium]|nr:ABC transporter substrate-binding protein [Chloroflexota bacterium]
MLARLLLNGKFLTLALVAALAFVIACGGAAEEPTDAPAPTAAPTQAAAPAATPSGAPPQEDRPTATSAAPAGAPPQEDRPTPTSAAPAAAATPTAMPQPTAVVPVSETTRLVYAIGAVANETNRPWAGSRQAYVQYEPMLENLLAKDVNDGQIVPRLAESWEASEDLSTWDIKLREGVQFHDGWGEFTSADLMHTLKILCREDSRLSTCGGITTRSERGDAMNYEEVLEVHDDYNVTFHGTRTNSNMLFYLGAQSGEMSPWSVAFWEAEGEAGLDEKGLVGTNTYQYLDRNQGTSIIMEKIDYDHWSGENPEFQELEITWIPEDASRYAGLLAGEIHVADLPIDLQQDAVSEGMALIKSRFTSNDVSIFFGGSYYATEAESGEFGKLSEEAHDPDQPWNDLNIRRAMNKAINRVELGDFLYAGYWQPMYIDGFHPTLEGWNDEWVERYDEEYGYDPDAARDLIEAAGYSTDRKEGPKGHIKVTANSYVSPGESELPQIIESITQYWNQIGIEAKLVDLDGSEVANRYRGRTMQNQVWPNIIIYFPLEYYFNIAYTSHGVTKHYEDDWLNARIKDLQVTYDTADRDDIARDIGNYMYDNHVSMPLFWFPHTITVNPEVVADWVYPGNTVPRLCCAAYAKAAR